MEKTQVYSLVNNATSEILGESALLKEDLSNVVDIGTAVFNANAVDDYVRSLVNQVGKVIFVNRPYAGGAPSVMMDSWQYGSVLEKITAELPEATENESWELNDGEDYSQDIFYKPNVSAKFFDKRVTFEIDMSFTERQVKQSFQSPAQLNGFTSMLYNSIDRSMTVKTDALIGRTINNMIAETVKAEYGSANINSKSTVKAVNLLYEYNQKNSTSLTADDALTTPAFIRYASFRMGLYQSRMTKISKLFNVGGKDRFTPADYLHIVLLSEFAKSAMAYLEADTFHNSLIALPTAETVPYWQGSGTGYSFTDTGKVYVKDASGDDVTVTGVLGVMFDRDALGVTVFDDERRVTTHYNAKAEFFNNYYKFGAGFYNDLCENFVVFFVA